MSRENKLQAIVLKKQDYSETDQIATLFSDELGKLRVFIKSAKLQTSKLQAYVQPGFEIKAVITSSNSLPKLIQAEILNAPKEIYSSAVLQKVWFAASELLLRALPDEQPNQGIYNELRHFLEFLAKTANLSINSDEIVYLGLVRFQLVTMGHLGLDLQTISADKDAKVLFSLSRGGFIASEEAGNDSRSIPAEMNQQIAWLKKASYNRILDLLQSQKSVQTESLAELVSEFINFQLEREIKSHRFLRSTL